MTTTILIDSPSSAMRTITLNRPNALNALNLDMIRTMTPQLLKYESQESDSKFVLLQGSGRAFCAGGDVKAVVKHGKEGSPEATSFFREEYQLDHLIGTFKKPIVALLDGITMGGGVGISVHAPIRIATENTLFAMPETAIGLFPDVGGSFFLPRLDGNLGVYLALTGARLKGQEVYWAGIASHYVPSIRLPALVDRLKQFDSPNLTAEALNKAIDEFSAEVDITQCGIFSDAQYQVIDSCFGYPTVEAIINALESSGTPFALKTLETMKKMSPTALKVSLQQIRRGSQLDFRQCFMMEFRLASRVVQALRTEGKSKDFLEGVDALLVSKSGKPKWSPASISEVSDDDVEWYFEHFEDGEDELDLLNSRTFEEYPHSFGLPSEKQILQTYGSIVARFNGKLPKKSQVLKEFEHQRSKPGVWEKIGFILSQRFSESADGLARIKSKV